MNDPLAARIGGVLERAADRAGHRGVERAHRLADGLGFGGWYRTATGAPGVVDARGRLEALRQTLLSEVAASVSTALERRGIPHVFVKGMALLGRWYRPGERAIEDIDLYIPPAARPDTLGALESLGFRSYAEREQAGPAALRSGQALGAAAAAPLDTASVDLHWGVEPVDRLLPRPGSPLPAAVWEARDCSGPLPVPRVEHHVALLIHHLVHHDLLHARGVLDVALLWRSLGAGAGDLLEELAGRFGVLRATRALGEVMVEQLGLAPLEGLAPAPRDRRGRAARDLMRLDRWLGCVARTPPVEHEMITLSRYRRRMVLVDGRLAAATLLADVLVPPRAHLAWRWPEARSAPGAWMRHLGHLARKLGRV